MKSVYLKTIDQHRNKSRFYAMYVVPDMWGGVSLVREFGQVGQPGTMRCQWHETNNDAQKELNTIKRQQLNKGYDFIN